MEEENGIDLVDLELELENKKYDKDLSVIIYNNNSEYLIKCLKKISKQDYDFKRVEIIIESTKLDEKVLKKINKLKLNCVIKEHDDLSVAYAYNEGLDITTGKFVYFINSNIILNSINIFKKIVKKDKKILIANMYYHDEDDDLTEEYKFNIEDNNTVRMDLAPGKIKMCLESVFIRREYILDLRFDEKFNEEAPIKFLMELLRLNKKYYCSTIKITTLAPYEDNTSKCAIQYNKNWYVTSLKNWINYAKNFNYVPIFIQEYLLYILYAKYNCNLNDRNKRVLSEEEIDEFIELSSQLLKYIDDRTIMQYKINSEYNTIKHKFKIARQLKYYFYKLKNGSDNEKYVIGTKVYELINNKPTTIFDFEGEKVNIHALNYDNGKLIFDCGLGAGDYLKDDEINIQISYGEELIEYKKLNVYNSSKVFGRDYANKYMFQFEININNNYNNLLMYLIFNNKRYKLGFNFVRLQSRLSNYNTSYWNYKDFTILNKKTKLVIEKSTWFKTLMLERKFLHTKFNVNEENKKEIKKLKRLRRLYYLTKPFMKNKNIWITFDKLYKAGDNGEYMYQYGLKHDKNIYYIIDKNSPDYERLVKQDKKHILTYGSLKNKLYVLHSKAILKTHANILSFLSFESVDRDLIKSIFNPEIIEIQHGLTIQDIPEYQNRLIDNVKLYSIASKKEYDNLIQEKYSYKKEQIKLNGLARYDGLVNNDKHQILITPTWRHDVASPSLKHGLPRGHNNIFKKSNYYKIYNSLINNKKLIEFAKKYDYSIIYLIHPTLSGQIDDFDKNDYVKIIPATSDISYEKILTESSLMVTDYSGVQYDFAYMRKPILYFHPDELPPHYDNSLDYEKDGFGKVIKTSDDLVDEICSKIKSNCENDKKYIERANNFFEFDDTNNCQRIYNEVNKYLKKNNGGN